MMVELEEDAPEADKRRRLNAVMREGRALLREYRRAENLYVVRHVMLEAARRLLALGEPISRDEVVSLARKIVEADPPPEWRFSADALLAQMRAAQVAEEPEKLREVLDEFVGLYQQDRAFAARALMQSAEVAEGWEAEELYEDYLDELNQGYSWVPGVMDFLMSHGVSVGGGRHTFVADLSLMDGGRLLIPQDTFGKTVALLFWSARDETSLDMLDHLQHAYERQRDRGFLVVGINMDKQEDEELVRGTLREKRVAWPQVFSGKGTDDPVALHYAIRQVPGVWIVHAMGLTAYKPEYRGRGWKHVEPAIRRELEEDYRRKLRQWDARSGLWLAEHMLRRAAERSGEPRAVPEDAINGLLDELFRMHLSPHMEERVERMQSILDAAGGLIEARPEAPNARGLRALRMMALQYLALTEEKLDLQREALDLARGFLEAEGAPVELRLISDYLLVRAGLSGRPEAHAEVDEKIRDLWEEYSELTEEWLWKWCGYLLWVEFGARGSPLGRAIQLGRAARENRTPPRGRGMARCLLQRSALGNKTFVARLEQFDGSELVLPDDLLGKSYVVHFWTMDYPPGAEWFAPMPPDRPNALFNKFEPAPERDYMIVGVNLDRDREAARRYAEEHFPDWIHTYVGQDRTHPLVRNNDIQALPSAWLVYSDGRVGATEADRKACGDPDGPIHDTRVAAKIVRGKPKETLLEWEDVYGRFRNILRKHELHHAMGFPMEEKEVIERIRRSCSERGREVLRAGLELNVRIIRESRAALKELLPALQRGEDGRWGAEEDLGEAWEYVRRFRRASENLRSMVTMAEQSTEWLPGEFPVAECRAAAAEVAPLDLPEGFPDPSPEKN